MDVSEIVLSQRQNKDGLEIEAVRKACRAVEAGHDWIMAGLKPGLTELELAAGLEQAHRLAGHEGHIFFRRPDFFMSRGPLASGPNLARFSGTVYSVTGARVRVLASGKRYDPGLNRITWDGRSDRGTTVASGVYFIRIKTRMGVRVTRAVLLK